MKKVIRYFFMLLCVTAGITIQAQPPQQIIYISGDDASTPELFIQKGETGFIFIQGGITANNNTTPVAFGTGTGTGTGNIVVNGGLFIGSNAGTPGDIINATNASFLFDYTFGSTATTTDLTGTLPVLTAAVDGVNTRGGIVHLMQGTQNFIGLNTNTTDDIVFYNLSLAGGSQDKNLQDVNIQTGMAAGAQSTGTLFLHNNYLNSAGNVVWVRNTSSSSAGTVPTSGLAISRDAAGGGVSNVGMGSLTQNSTSTAGMVTSTGQGRLRRSVVSGAGIYLFPIGTSDKAYYRPAEIINPVTNTTYYIRLQAPNVNQSSFGTPVPRITHSRYFHVINSDDNASDPEFRLYGTMSEFRGSNPFSCTDAQILQDLGLAQSALGGNSQWGYQDGLATDPGSGYLGYVTSVNYPSTGTGCGAGSRITYRAWTGISGIAANEEGYVFAAKPVACTVNSLCFALPGSSLLYFGAQLVTKDEVQTEWTISEEEQLRKYELERSTDGYNFNTIAEVPVLIPSRNKTYTYKDLLNKVINGKGIVYYRLKQYSTDGKNTLSKVVSISLQSEGIFQVYPNPFAGQISIQLPGSNTTASVSIYDAAGKLVAKQNKSGNFILCDGLEKLAPGIYSLQVKTATQLYHQKIIRQ